MHLSRAYSQSIHYSIPQFRDICSSSAFNISTYHPICVVFHMGSFRATARDYGWLMGLYTLSSFVQMFPLVSFGTLLNVELGFSASEITFYYAAIFLPWNFRAFYGLISDSVPLFRSRRRVYMVICYCFVSICFVIYGRCVETAANAFLVGVMLNVFFSFSEAVLDAVAVDMVTLIPLEEDSHAGRMKRSTDIQSAGMTFRTIGSLLAIPIAGGLSTVLDSRTMICLTSVFPLMAVCICIFRVVERQAQSETLHKRTMHFIAYLKTCAGERRFPSELVATVKPVLLPSIFILLYASSPSSNQAFSNFLFTSLPFSQVDYHAVSLCATIGSLIGTLTYWKAFRSSTNLRTGFVVSLVVSAFAACSRLLIIHGWQNLYFVCVDEALVNLAFRLTLMPVQVYASIAASAPDHLMFEGFIYGLFASIENWGGTLSGVVSGLLADHMSLTVLVLVSASVSFVPLLALNLIQPPKISLAEKVDDEGSVQQRTDVPI